MKKVLFAVLTVCTLCACNSKPKFEIKGEISGAEGKMLYFESSGLGGIESLDSVKLRKDGSFDFKEARPESPEFYQLRMGNQIINVSIDSIETITIKAPYESFSTNYIVGGSENCSKIKELTLKQIRLQSAVDSLSKGVQNKTVSADAYDALVNKLLNTYKDDVKINYIYAHPNTTYAYFALFQKLNNYLIFDPLNNKEDIKCFGAVATSLDLNYHNAERTKNLCNIVIRGMKNTSAPRTKVIQLPADKISQTGVIEIGLRDLHGNICNLTSLKGKVVLLDFTVYQSAFAAAHNLKLRELYNKYAKSGFEIYQVSLDADEHFWKTSADNLPWICVRDENGIYSTIATTYNVKTLPAMFLINRKNDFSSRTNQIKDLDSTIKALL